MLFTGVVNQVGSFSHKLVFFLKPVEKECRFKALQHWLHFSDPEASSILCTVTGFSTFQLIVSVFPTTLLFIILFKCSSDISVKTHQPSSKWQTKFGDRSWWRPKTEPQAEWISPWWQRRYSTWILLLHICWKTSQYDAMNLIVYKRTFILMILILFHKVFLWSSWKFHIRNPERFTTCDSTSHVVRNCPIFLRFKINFPCYSGYSAVQRLHAEVSPLFVWVYWCHPPPPPPTYTHPPSPHWDAGRLSLIPWELIRISGEERAPDRVRTNCTAALHSDAFRSVFMSVCFGCTSVDLSGWQMRDWPAQALDNHVEHRHNR